MGDLSAHFSRVEFACHGLGRPGHPGHPTTVRSSLVATLEALRHQQGDRPLRIISGERCPWWNSRVGGASRSRHLYGDAADIPEGYATVAQAAAAGFDGIGDKNGWAVHVDKRGTKARWHY